MMSQMHWAEKQEWYAAGYDYARDIGEMPNHDMSDYGNEGKHTYLEGAREGLAANRENRGIPAMTSAEMHEFENC